MNERNYRLRQVTGLSLSLVLAVMVSSRSAQAQDVTNQIAKINEQVEQEGVKLKAITERENELVVKVKSLKAHIESYQTEENSVSRDLTRVRADTQRINGEVTDSQARIQRLERLSLERLRVIYVNRNFSVVDSLLLTSSSGDVAQTAHYLSKVRDFDNRLASQLSTLVLKREEDKKRLARLLDLSEQLAQKLKDGRALIQQYIKTQEVLLKSIRNERAQREQLYASLQAQALRLETVVVSLTGGQEDPPPKLADSEIEHPASEHEQVGSEPFVGPGLFSSKGKLLRPVLGKMVAGYGKDRKPGFEGLVMRKGIDYLVSSGSDVKVIAPGKVIFTGRMPGYGTIAIIDHGQRYYSLYGRLSQILVSLGQILEKGAIIGQVGGEAESNFYFEIRKEGKSVNPQQFY